MSSSRSSGRPVRRSVTAAAVLALVVPLLALLGLVTSPAEAADNITFRASAQAAANQITHRVTIPACGPGDRRPAALRHQQQGARRQSSATPAGWTLDGTRLSSTDTETRLYSKVATANDAGRSQAVDFTATTKASLMLLAYDGTAPPTRSRSSPRRPRPPTGPRTPHPAPTSRPRARTSSPTGPTSPRPPPAGRSRPARPSAASPSAPVPGRITSVASDLNAPAPSARHLPAPPPPTPRRARRRCGPSCCRPTQTRNPNVAPVASFTTSCPHRDLHGRRARAPPTPRPAPWRRTPGTSATAARPPVCPRRTRTRPAAPRRSR